MRTALDLKPQRPPGGAVRTQWGRDPTAPLTMGLILELTCNIGRENARMHAGERLQKFVGMEIEAGTPVWSASASSAPRFPARQSVRHERSHGART
jgi:hypothetical protein